LVADLRAAGARVSLFVDAGVRGLAQAAGIGVERVELYTGPFAQAHAAGDARHELAALAQTAREAQAAGLAVNAGHDLSQANLADFLAGVPGVAEVSIGHALIDEALYAGLDATVKAYLRILAQAR
jgi:pyridoxine 5-phosphate synthase